MLAEQQHMYIKPVEQQEGIQSIYIRDQSAIISFFLILNFVEFIAQTKPNK